MALLGCMSFCSSRNIPMFAQSKNISTTINVELNNKNYMGDGTDIKWEDTTDFKFPITGGRVIKVYDGDTITLASKLPYDGSPLYRFPVRLNGIDCPEIKGKTEEEKTEAKNAREALAGLILNKYVRLENVNNEKFGRILADVYLQDLHLNEWMIKNRYAVKYNGGSKIAPQSWHKYKLTGEM